MSKKPSKNSTKSSRKKKESLEQLDAKDCAALSNIIDKALVSIEKIQSKEAAQNKKIDTQNKKLFAAKNDTERLERSFSLEGLKIEAFANVEKDYQKLSPLLNEAYRYAERLGGIIKSDFLDISQSLAKEIHLDAMVNGLKKIQVELRKHLDS